VDSAPSTPIAALERELREPAGRLKFGPALEPLYLAEHADSIVARRLSLVAASIVLVGIAPVLNAFLLHPPEAFNRPALIAQFGVMIPALLVSAVVTGWRRTRPWQDPVAAVVAFTVAAGLLYERHIGAAVGFAIPIELVSVVLLGTAVLGGLRMVYFVPTVIAIVAAFAINETGTFGVSAAALNTIAAMAMMAVLAAIGSYMEERSARAEWLHRRLAEELAGHDALSGLANARSFGETYPRLHAAAARTGKPLLVAMLDIDWFKNFNDHYGHPAGDECIRRVAQVLPRYGRRATDLAARIGGEEFALVWYDIEASHAQALLEALRMEVEAMKIPHAAAPAGAHIVTVSIGACCARPVGLAPEALIKAADDQLYRSKEAGRNRVSVGAI
jgi:diguanylate cyclase (GGDEF)-like protein